jgi:hypothetical protein
MKRVILSILLLAAIVLAGCNQQAQKPLSICDSKTEIVTLGYLGANAYFIAYPEKANDPNFVAEVQSALNDGYSCLQGLCADPNNPTYDVCLNAALKRLNIKLQAPIIMPIAMPEK